MHPLGATHHSRQSRTEGCRVFEVVECLLERVRHLALIIREAFAASGDLNARALIGYGAWWWRWRRRLPLSYVK